MQQFPVMGKSRLLKIKKLFLAKKKMEKVTLFAKLLRFEQNSLGYEITPTRVFKYCKVDRCTEVAL
jgi:hypothetical protein